MQSLWLYLHFGQLQLDSLQAQQPEQQRALIIVDETDMQVLQCNQVALNAGIKTGMSLGAAAALHRDLDVLPYQARVETDRLCEIADKLYWVTSDISFFSDNGLLLRIHTMLHLYGGLSTYWQVIQNQLTPLKLSYQYATANSPLAAKMLALAGVNQVTTDHQNIKRKLNKIPLPFSELDDKSVQKLKRVGVHTLGELLAIPLTDIAKRFTADLSVYLGQLTGEIAHPVSFYHPPEHFERYLELLYEISHTQTLIHPLMILLKALEQFLKLRDWLTQTLHIDLHLRDRDQVRISVGSQQGEYQAHIWAKLIELQLENVQLLAPVFAISLSTSQAYIRQPDKTDLFAGKQGELSRLQLVSLLQAKLGENSVFSPAMQDDYRPEQVLVKHSALASQSPPKQLHAMRPTFLLEKPQTLTEKVSIQHGPERIQTGWWDKGEIQRDYFIARSQQGQWYWVFRTPEQEWFLHGVFS